MGINTFGFDSETGPGADSTQIISNTTISDSTSSTNTDSTANSLIANFTDAHKIIDAQLRTMTSKMSNYTFGNYHEVNEELKHSMREIVTVIDKKNKQVGLKEIPWDRVYVPQPPVISFKSKPIGKKSNIVTIVAHEGIGKSHVSSSIASLYLNSNSDGLGFEINAPKGLIYLDTENPEEDHESIRHCMKKRADFLGKPKPEKFEYYYNLDSDTPVEDLIHLLEKAPSILIVDGLSDMMSDVNDLHESAKLVKQIIRLLSKHQVCLVTTIHLNPSNGKNESSKPRGHLGSELLRKSSGVVILSGAVEKKLKTKKVRGALAGLEHCFIWDNDKNLFVSCDPPTANPKSKKEQEYEDLCHDILSFISGEMTRTKIFNAIKKLTGEENRNKINHKINQLKKYGFLSGENENIELHLPDSEPEVDPNELFKDIFDD